MPVSIQQYLVNGSRFTFNIQGGEHVERYLVEGLTPSRDLLARACVATDANTGFRIPKFAEAHPSLGGIFATQIEGAPFKNSRSKALVTVTFSNPQVRLSNGVKVTIETTNVQIPTVKDPQTGEIMHVSYTEPGKTRPVQNIVRGQTMIPHTLLTFERIEAGSPLKKAQSYTGTCNMDTWQNGKPYTWLCRQLRATPLGNLLDIQGGVFNGDNVAGGANNPQVAGGGAYVVEYGFEYDPLDWTQDFFWEDPVLHTFATDAKRSKNNDKGVFTFRPRAQSFAALKLPNVF